MALPRKVFQLPPVPITRRYEPAFQADFGVSIQTSSAGARSNASPFTIWPWPSSTRISRRASAVSSDSGTGS